MSSEINSIQVQATNDASIVSKQSMINKNYFNDDFTKEFVFRNQNRAPLINLGYFTRAFIINKVLLSFIKHAKRFSKIISCGSGFDSTYFRLTNDGHLPKAESLYIEIDYKDVIERKLEIIKSSSTLNSFGNVPNGEIQGNVFILNENYILIACDLSNIVELENLLKKCQIDFVLPTLFISECAITYMKQTDSNNLLKWCTNKFPCSSFLNYEQINPDDGFGCVMMKHFDKLQSPLCSVKSYKTVQSHRERFLELGWYKCLAESEWDCVPQTEMASACEKEMFDEWEELHLKCCHYVVVVALSGALLDWSFVLSQHPICSFEPRISNNMEVTPVQLDSQFYLELYGHCGTRLKNNDLIVFGGFGKSDVNSGHSRSRNSFLLRSTNEGVNYTSLKCNSVQQDRVRGCCLSFRVSEREYVMLYGGRRSPCASSDDGIPRVYTLHPEDGMLFDMGLVVVPDGDLGTPVPRYRHTMVLGSCTGDQVQGWVFGGRSVQAQAMLSDLWSFTLTLTDLVKLTWSEIVDVDMDRQPQCRASHSSVMDAHNNIMYVTCGLSQCYLPLGDLWKFDVSGRRWQKVELNNQLTPRYGHTSHYLHDKLLLVGGVNADSRRQPFITVVYLDKFICVDYQLSHQPEKPLLMINHTSTIVSCDEESVTALLVGGGGNCFSFGSHFNHFLTQLSVKFCPK